MDGVGSLIDQILDSAVTPQVSERELRARKELIGRLFLFYREDSGQRADVYLDETFEIPLFWLYVAVRLVLRSHVYPGCPAIADLWRVARHAAGMDRQQYHAGRYLKPPRKWPPDGKRYAVVRGQFERVPERLNAIPGRSPMLLQAGED